MLIAVILLAWLSIQTTVVQNWLVGKVTDRLSRELNTTVRVEHVDFALFNKMLLEGTLVTDQHKDTLLYAGAVKVRITDWFFFKDKIELKYIGLENASIHLKRNTPTWNYEFIIDFFSGPRKSPSNHSIDLNIKKLEVNNLYLMQEDGWRGENMLLRLAALSVDADHINFNTHKARINTIKCEKPYFSIYTYTGTRPDSLIPKDIAEKYVNDPHHLRWNPDGWDIVVNAMTLNNGSFANDIQTERAPYTYFDGSHILFSQINARFNQLRLRSDTLSAVVTLSTQERSGFTVNQLKANMKMHPESWEFANLDLRTNHSHLQNYFAMRYASFNDMDNFNAKVTMEGHFNEAELASDDIAYFAPGLKDWKKQIRINGKIKGPVENLTAKNLMIAAGKDTYLKGDVVVHGLPDVNKTFVDFEASDFRTTYSDAVTLIPALKSVDVPRLNRLQYLRFRGNFTGFFTNFVTYGTLESNLGTLVTDLNMKLPARGPSEYAGNIKTDNFALGELFDMPDVGKISFRGKIDGAGLQSSTLNARLNGNISLLEFNGYPYQDITVKGTVAKKLFNGNLTVKDPNLDVALAGLIDFSKKLPQFDFEADVAKADLKTTHLANRKIDFNGHFKLNFTGNDVDNFLGTAKVYDASIYRNGQRIPFDSLNIESKIVDNNKVITVLSNEFDAALAGEFSIKDLPSSFATFLNKYYPSYIKASRNAPKNENFSFVVTTKKVDDYIGLIDENLHGFNFSTFTGRINTKENLLDVNADVPQFNYKNIAVYNFSVKGTGNLDSLSVQSSIADVYINDSLHFPGTTVHVASANDVSNVSIKTSASQTLNWASISAKVQTMPKGLSILFNESNFDLNGKSWTIDKNGELVFTEDLIKASGLRIYNGQQAILITTHPSDIGNTNDIKVDLKKVNIGDFTPYFIKKNRLEGLLTGTINVADPFRKVQVSVDATAEQFRLDDDSIGIVKMNAGYDQHTKNINFNAISDNRNYNFSLKGLYHLADSTNADQLDMVTDLKNTRIDLLLPYLNSVFSEVNGLATGQLHITGPPSKLKYLGKMQLRNGQLRVKYTNVLYTIPYATIDMQEDRIDFGNFAIRDQFGNIGQLTRGILKHQSFDKLDFNFALNTNKLLVLSTSGVGNDSYFGTVFAKANMTLTGKLEDMVMQIRGEPADSSKLYIRSRAGRENNQSAYIVWKQYGHEMETQQSLDESKLTVNMDVNVNNYANVYVIIDELTGDIIQANGRGNLNIKATTAGEFAINGQYDIDRGSYNFNFQSLLRKPFKLSEDAGNYIRWKGDPYDAEIKIDAEYEAENVRFNDLGLDQFSVQSGTTDNSGRINDNVRKYRGKVLVIATLSERLMSPSIKFQIELPQGSPLKNDPDAQAILQRIQSDENELNKQVAFLIVFNSFGPVSTASQSNLGGLAFEGIVVNSISGVLSSTLSKQFSSLFQKIFNDKSIRVNFNAQLYSGNNLLTNTGPGSNPAASNAFNIDRTNLNLSINKSLFNERLSFTFGSAVDFGLSSRQVQSAHGVPLLPDLTAEWKITPEGKFVLTFFYRDSYNYLTGNAARQNRSGASISYRREFERLGDLFLGEKKRKPANKPDSSSRDTSGSN